MNWLSHIGSLVGFLTGVFVLFDRLLRNRPRVTVRRGQGNEGRRALFLAITNPSAEDILVFFGKPHRNGIIVRPDTIGDPSDTFSDEGFEALLSGGETRLFPIALGESRDAHHPVGFTVRWVRTSSSWMPQWPCRIRTTVGILRQMQTAR